ncbi:NeuD/PglB/VioB family sugar acetyltransferase [Solwaraspora sp. WMMD406]|uniref:NeuD/PglB/VioB family sugar acetyltransferase n=1 Tax=Solwaraspora sp. WMMD406 TaxID=3016095 RepID=UPI002415EF48|nr:NeuD/PglB/VioB family sugar acetyltransferase [Solwaraspora sp. WMMD406]MDG4766078.1 NeuD/PglB/VioB family sugar acetyltransferase [Solwaraspora sp. WMMD406]
MTPRDIVIIGCGGHGREVLGIVTAINHAAAVPPWRVVGFLDDDPSPSHKERVDRLGVPLLGAVSWLTTAVDPPDYVIGIGVPAYRRAVAERLDTAGTPAPVTLIHPAASVGADSAIGAGSVLFAGARVTTNVTIGRHVHLNQNCTVGHDTEIGDYSSVNPLAAVSGGVHLGAAVLVGTTAAVLQGLRIGAGATVGAGACVVRDVAPGVVVKGVPAR